MSTLKIGAKGSEVIMLQKRLKSAGHFPYSIDGDFGPQTERAVKAFQKSIGIKADGIVGPITTAKLETPKTKTSSKVASYTSTQKPLAQKCLELTATIETSKVPPHCFAAVSGNFDKMAVSYGALQWNFGQKSLQPILNHLIKNHETIVKSCFPFHYEKLVQLLNGPHEDLMTYFCDVQVSDKPEWEKWKTEFKNLGYTNECVEAQLKESSVKYRKALELCVTYNLKTERAVALMFDIIVQNGSIKESTKAQILEDFKKVTAEPEKLLIVAKRRTADSKPEWQKDVLSRKQTIAQGSGVIHGKKFDLESEFGIQNKEAEDLKSHYNSLSKSA